MRADPLGQIDKFLLAKYMSGTTAGAFSTSRAIPSSSLVNAEDLVSRPLITGIGVPRSWSIAHPWVTGSRPNHTKMVRVGRGSRP